jgi:hypothetical protein
VWILIPSEAGDPNEVLLCLPVHPRLCLGICAAGGLWVSQVHPQNPTCTADGKKGSTATQEPHVSSSSDGSCGSNSSSTTDSFRLRTEARQLPIATHVSWWVVCCERAPQRHLPRRQSLAGGRVEQASCCTSCQERLSRAMFQFSCGEKRASDDQRAVKLFEWYEEAGNRQ